MKQWIRGLAAMLLAMVATVASAQPKALALGVYSFLGDGVDVTSSDDSPRDTRLERTSRETLDFRNIGFDLIALRVAREAVLAQRPGSKVMMYRSPAPMATAEQRRLAVSATRAELPAWMVKTIGDERLTHLLIITRNRGPISARTGDGDAIGRGHVDGIGLYMDTLYTIRNATTGALSTGLLAPHAQLKLQLMDAVSGDILATYDVRDALTYGAQDTQVRADPWSFMSNEDKVRVLRQIVEDGVRRAMPDLIAKL